MMDQRSKSHYRPIDSHILNRRPHKVMVPIKAVCMPYGWLRADIYDWLLQNGHSWEWTFVIDEMIAEDMAIFYFSSKNAAILFKLTWL